MGSHLQSTARGENKEVLVKASRHQGETRVGARDRDKRRHPL